MSLARLRVIYAALPPQGWVFLLGWAATTAVKILVLGELPETHMSDLAYVARALGVLVVLVGFIVLFAVRARATTPARFVARGGAFVAGPAVHVKAVPAFGVALWWGYAFDALPMMGLWWRIRESLLRVHPGYTADAIGYYGLHPGHRPAIGTDAERVRLHGELSHIWFRRFHGLGGRGPGQG